MLKRACKARFPQLSCPGRNSRNGSLQANVSLTPQTCVLASPRPASTAQHDFPIQPVRIDPQVIDRCRQKETSDSTPFQYESIETDHWVSDERKRDSSISSCSKVYYYLTIIAVPYVVLVPMSEKKEVERRNRTDLSIRFHIEHCSLRSSEKQVSHQNDLQPLSSGVKTYILYQTPALKPLYRELH